MEPIVIKVLGVLCPNLTDDGKESSVKDTRLVTVNFHHSLSGHQEIEETGQTMKESLILWTNAPLVLKKRAVSPKE